MFANPHICHLKINTNTVTTTGERLRSGTDEIDAEYVSSSRGAGATLGNSQFSDGSS